MEYTRKRIINKNIDYRNSKGGRIMFLMDKQIMRFMNQFTVSRLVQFFNSPTSIVKLREK